MEKEVTLPHSKESEMMVLGCMLTSINALNIVANKLHEHDFYYPEHKIIYSVLQGFFWQDKPADVHLVCEELKRKEKLEVVGGAAYVTALAQYVGTSAYIEEYIKELKYYSASRGLLDLSTDLNNKVLNGDDPNQLVIFFQEGLKLIERNNGINDKFPIKFLNEYEQNFLLVEPEKKPMLLEYVNENRTPIGFLPKGIVAMLVGAGGIGKTHLLAQLAISVATGTPWLGKYSTTDHCGIEKKGNVFLGLGENQYDDIHRVLYKASKKIRKPQPDILEEDPLIEVSKRIAAFSFCGQQASFIQDGNPSIYFREFKMKLEETAPAEGWTLIILDPVSRLMGADAETDNAAATQFIALLEELTIDLPGNPTILFAHHVNKAAIQNDKGLSQAAARGSSALTDGVRWQVNFSKGDDKKVLKMTKSNFTAICDETEIESETDGYLNAVRKISIKK